MKRSVLFLFVGTFVRGCWEPRILKSGPCCLPTNENYDLANACLAAAIVCRTSSSVWVEPRNAASYCDGGRYTPLSSRLRKNPPKASVLDFDAESQSVTGPGVKNQENIDPTPLWQSGTPPSLAAAATPSTSIPLNRSIRG